MTMTGDKLLAWLPYFAAYALGPFAVLAGRLAGRPELFRPYGPQGLAPWLALAGLALVVCLARDVFSRTRQSRPAWPGLLLAAALGTAILAASRLFGPALAQAATLAPLLDEMRLPALALFAGAWTWTFGAPPRAALARLGGGLGALALLDFLLTAIMARQVVLGGGLLLGGGAASADSLALLLCIALAATLDPSARDDSHGQPGGEAPGPRHAGLARWLILAGLFASFSRSGLAAAGVMLLLVERGPLQQRLGLALACALGIWMSLALPLARPLGGGEDLGLAWHLTATLEALAQNPRAWALGLPLAEPVALAMPDMGGLEWDPDSAGLAVSVFEIPSSWLRLLAAWGAGGPLLVLGGALACALRGRGRFGLGLVAALLVSAALTPALYTPATAAALALACALAWGDAPASRRKPQEIEWP